MKSNDIKFSNANGDVLKARIDLPPDQHPIAFVLFAHCFTCSKNLSAVRNISRGMTRNGWGVFRFDFTGLGESEGDFSETNFSSNIEDLVEAANFMAQEFSAPSLLIGHSLGGAAVIFAADSIPSVQAIATIAAPATPGHIKHLFRDDLSVIQKKGSATLQIAGRDFTIKKQFLDDIGNQNLSKALSELAKPYLILHSPQDRVVEIANAAKLYAAAKHPKSFISLDGADHLLNNKEDSQYAGDVIAGWAKRYVSIPKKTALRTQHQVAVSLGSEGFTTDIQAGKHSLVADEPEEVGGDDFGPSPYDLLLSSLGACTAMTLKMYADRKGWDFDEIVVHLEHSKSYPEDIQDHSDHKGKIDRIERYIEVDSELNQEQLQRLLEIANKCPVHKTLHSPVEVISKLMPLNQK